MMTLWFILFLQVVFCSNDLQYSTDYGTGPRVLSNNAVWQFDLFESSADDAIGTRIRSIQFVNRLCCADIRVMTSNGAVFAFYMYNDNGDELDFEFLPGRRVDSVWVNAFKNRIPVLGRNGFFVRLPRRKRITNYSTYCISKTSSTIFWTVDNKTIYRARLSQYRNMRLFISIWSQRSKSNWTGGVFRGRTSAFVKNLYCR